MNTPNTVGFNVSVHDIEFSVWLACISLLVCLYARHAAAAIAFFIHQTTVVVAADVIV